MSEIKETLMDIAASIYMKPCDFKELKSRDFLKGKSEHGINVFLSMAKEKGYIYQRNDVFYCYKKTVKNILNPNGYELD